MRKTEGKRWKLIEMSEPIERVVLPPGHVALIMPKDFACRVGDAIYLGGNEEDLDELGTELEKFAEAT